MKCLSGTVRDAGGEFDPTWHTLNESEQAFLRAPEPAPGSNAASTCLGPTPGAFCVLATLAAAGPPGRSARSAHGQLAGTPGTPPPPPTSATTTAKPEPPTRRTLTVSTRPDVIQTAICSPQGANPSGPKGNGRETDDFADWSAERSLEGSPTSGPSQAGVRGGWRRVAALEGTRGVPPPAPTYRRAALLWGPPRISRSRLRRSDRPQPQKRIGLPK